MTALNVTDTAILLLNGQYGPEVGLSLIHISMECTYGKPVPYEGLGYERKAAGIRKSSSLTFAFDEDVYKRQV